LEDRDFVEGNEGKRGKIYNISKKENGIYKLGNGDGGYKKEKEDKKTNVGVRRLPNNEKEKENEIFLYFIKNF
jgi:hypothetical protein